MKLPACHIDNYPRPQFVRKNFINLNGEWDFEFDPENVGEKEKWYKKTAFSRKITVPFVYQTEASGIFEPDNHVNNVWYLKKLSYNKKKDKRFILNFEGVDFIAKVYVNGEMVGTHRGAYTRFSFDITNYLKAENVIVVKCEDSLSRTQPRGKQRWEKENFGCWYTDTTGIWKTVWAEEVATSYLKSASYSCDFANNYVTYEYEIENFKEGLSLEIEVSFRGKLLNKTEKTMTERLGTMAFTLTSVNENWGYQAWNHAWPNLYDIVFTLKYNGKAIDEVGSYLGFTQYSTNNQQILVNYSPTYLRMVLDQGYFPKSDLTPKDDAEIIQDIKLMQDMGFNGARKHQKIEDERFYYYCDVMGLYAWCEMPSPFEFCEEEVELTMKEWIDIVRQYKNHPSIMTWVAFNESWGVLNILNNPKQQALTVSAYYLVKSLDQNKFVISNDGWEHTKSDLITIHDYSDNGAKLKEIYGDINNVSTTTVSRSRENRPIFARGFKYEGQPVLISEYGGIAFTGDKAKDAWGYGNKVETEADFLKRYEDTTDGIYACPNVSGFCVTQLTDVMQEVNGLLTMDRKPKVSVAELKRIHSK